MVRSSVSGYRVTAENFAVRAPACPGQMGEEQQSYGKKRHGAQNGQIAFMDMCVRHTRFLRFCGLRQWCDFDIHIYYTTHTGIVSSV